MTQIPTKEQIRDWLAAHPGASTKRDIAKAFGLQGAARIELKRLLKELEAEGSYARHRDPMSLAPDKFPPVTVLAMLPPDAAGDQFAEPLEWQGAGPAPRVLFVPTRGEAALAAGDRFLARMTEVAGEEHGWEARLLRRIGQAAHRIVGVFRKTAEGGRITPIDKGAEREWRVAAAATLDARTGELVEAELAGPKGRMGLPAARVVARLGDASAPRAVSLLAIHQHGIPDDFPDAVIAEADAAALVPDDYGEDLRALPFVTIDPADARDHDDACFAEPDDDPANERGHILWVAIADVAHFVRPGTALDAEARKRGNSTYFPDRVVPMLPDRLSGDLCSLHEGVPRPVIALRIKLDSAGNKLGHRFVRGMIKSVASLSYDEVQAARDGQPNTRCAALLGPVIAPLYAAHAALARARAARQPLDLDLPERKIEIGDDGHVRAVGFKQRLVAHQLIEEFMVLANVAAAEELERLRRPLLYRVHEEPSPEKLDALREVAQASGFTLARGQVLKTAHLNRLLAQAEGSEFDELLNITTLRSMQQAYYLPQNLGHFGLALRSYAHFTSPIRRYSDLIVHRALISGHGWGDDGLSHADIDGLEKTAQHVSETERRSMAAERYTTDRYLAAYLADRVGSEFPGRISGVQRFGAFVKLDETGADGLIPIRDIGREYFHYDREAQTLRGADTGLTIGIGQRVTVRLAEAVPVTGGLMLELLELEGRALPGPGGSRPGAPRGRRLAASKAFERGIRRKERRKR